MLPKSDLEEFINQVAVEQPDYAEYLFRVVRADATRKEVAEFFGIAFDTVDLWKRKGMPYEGINGVESKYCLSDVAKWLSQQKIIKVGNEETEQIERELKQEKLKTAQLNRERQEGKLVNREEITTVVLQTLTEIKTGIKNWHVKFGDDAVQSLNSLIDRVAKRFNRDIERKFNDD